MKKIIILLIICISVSTLSFSQCPNNGDNYYRPDMDKFEGTWKYMSGGIEATLMIKKIHRLYTYPTQSFYDDLLIGVVKVVSSGVVLYDNTNEYGDLSTSTYRPKLTLNLDCSVNVPDKASGYLRDVVKQKTVEIKVSYIAGTVPQLFVTQLNPERFGLKNRNGTTASEDIRNPNGTFDAGFTLPTDVYFIKQP